MAGEALRPTGSTNEDWGMLGGERQRSPEQQRANEERLGRVAKNATPRPEGEPAAEAEQTEADKAQAAQQAELENRIKQFEHNRQNAQDMLEALERKKPSETKNAKKREHLENRIRNAKAAIERHDKKLAELRGELAHLVVGDGTPDLKIVQGGVMIWANRLKRRSWR